MGGLGRGTPFVFRHVRNRSDVSFGVVGKVMTILVNGELFVFDVDGQVKLQGVSEFDLHVVSVVDCSVSIVCDRTSVQTKMVTGMCFTLICGGEVTVSVSLARQTNASEEEFVATSVEGLLNTKDCGAPQLSHLLHTSRWLPQHAETLLKCNDLVNLFEAASMICCVARKKAKPKYHRRLPKIRRPMGIAEIVARSAHCEPTWKQCGATFSTMMRYFQKVPEKFEWRTDEERRTTIKCS